MNWKILRSPTTATNLNFKSFCELGKKLKVQPTVENKRNLHKIRLGT